MLDMCLPFGIGKPARYLKQITRVERLNGEFSGYFTRVGSPIRIHGVIIYPVRIRAATAVGQLYGLC